MEYLTIIQQVIAEHQLMRDAGKRVGESMNDIEALFSLQRASSTWSQGSRDALVEQQKKLQETVEILERGLKKHFGFEEEYLPPIFGDILMRALLVEHAEIKKNIAQVKSTLTNYYLEGLTREESWDQKANIQQPIWDTTQMLEEHAGREEVILKMIERALQTGPAG